MPIVFPWEKRELEEIAAEMNIKLGFKPSQAFIDKGGTCVVTLYRWIIQGFCPFFNRASKHCIIHEDKPLACRMYPLLVELPSGKLIASGKCEWIKQHGPKLMEHLSARPELIPEIFPNEFEAAKRVFIEFMTINSFIERHGLRLMDVSKLGECANVYDIDEYMARSE